MAEKNPAVYLVDMVGACEKILRYCENRTVAEFVDDTLLYSSRISFEGFPQQCLRSVFKELDRMVLLDYA